MICFDRLTHIFQIPKHFWRKDIYDLPLGLDGLLKVRYLLVCHVFLGLCVHRCADFIILHLLHLLQSSLISNPLRLDLRWGFILEFLS